MSSTQSEGTTADDMQREPERHFRPMPVDIYTAAITGDNNILTHRLGLYGEEQNHRQEPVDAANPSLQQMETTNRRSNLESVTQFGDTILHLLITNSHSELTLKVFRKDKYLLKAENYKLETPLHCLARVGNEVVWTNLIQHNYEAVKDVLDKTNNKGETALHIAARHGNKEIGRQLMKMDSDMAYKVNNEKQSPLYLALANRCTEMVQVMLEEDATLACIPDLDGMFPVHVAARTGNVKLVNHFIEKYPNYAMLLNPCGKNLFHIAADDNQVEIFVHVDDERFKGTVAMMNCKTDYDGNTPLHIAAMNGHLYIMLAILEKKMNCDAQTIRNKQGLTPIELSARQVLENSEGFRYNTERKINSYFRTNGSERLTQVWLKDVVRMSTQNNWLKVQIIGLGSVLITTISFAAAFTIPGGYQSDGTPVLAEKYMFKAFVLANTSAFITAFMSLFTLLVRASGIPFSNVIRFASYLFLLASSSMVVAFGLGSYVSLYPNNKAIAVLILGVTLLLGSPAVMFVISKGLDLYNFLGRSSPEVQPTVLGWSVYASYALSFVFIFFLAYVQV